MLYLISYLAVLNRSFQTAVSKHNLFRQLKLLLTSPQGEHWYGVRRGANHAWRHQHEYHHARRDQLAALCWASYSCHEASYLSECSRVHTSVRAALCCPRKSSSLRYLSSVDVTKAIKGPSGGSVRAVPRSSSARHLLHALLALPSETASQWVAIWNVH